MIEEILGLGFKRVELSHGIRISLVPGILQAVEEGIIEISSVHNFCPLPNMVQHAAPNLYRPSAHDVRERDLWHRYSVQTLDFAVKVGANRIVMHSGGTEHFFGSPEKRLDRWVEKSGLQANELAANKAFCRRRDRTMKRIQTASSRWLNRVHRSYKKLLPEVRERGLVLGLENREGLEELPGDAAFVDFMRQFGDDAPVAYWHDAGHAQLKQQYGLIDHAAHLEKMAPHLIGFHLHDVTDEGKDHQAPGSGVIDFKMIARHVQPEHTLVLELSPSLQAEEVLASRAYIAAQLS